MICCLNCKRSCLVTEQEELKDCPWCASEGWSIHHVHPGRRPHNTRVLRAVAMSKNPPRGACFITPKGYLIALAQMRYYELALKKRKPGRGNEPLKARSASGSS